MAKKKEEYKGHGSVREPSEKEYQLAFPEPPELGEPTSPEEVKRFTEVMGWLAQKLGMAQGPELPPPTPGIEQPTDEQIKERLRVEQEMGMTRGEGAY